MSASKIYIHPKALALLEKVFVDANIRPVLVQTQGNAAASAGTHAKDGTYDLNGKKQSYCAAIDLSVNQKATRISDNAKITMNEERIKWLLFNLAKNGIVGWYRRPSQGFDAAHMHIITSMVPMKTMLENQVIDFLNDRTGLVGHKTETFWTAAAEHDQRIADLLIAANPEARSRVPANYR